MGPGIIFSLRLGRRFARSGFLARSALIMAVAATFIVGMFIVLSAFTLSGSQVADRDLGSYENRASLGNVAPQPPGDGRLLTQLTTAGRSAGASDLVSFLASIDIRPSGTAPPLTSFMETQWSKDTFPQRFVLDSGTWPSHAGEVVITHADTLNVAAGSSLSVLSGAATFHVVGTAHDRYARFPSILAAPGTWASISPDVLAAFPGITGQPSVLWSTGDPKRVITTLSAVLAARSGKTAENSPSLAAFVTTRQEVLSQHEHSWITRIPAAYSVPSLALPLLAMLFMLGLNDRRFRANIRILTDLGIRPAHAVNGLCIALVIWALMAAATGIAIGAALGFGLHPVIQRFRDQPVSSVPSLTQPIVRLLVMIIIGGVLAAIVLHTSITRRGEQPSGHTDRSRKSRTLRRFGAFTVGCATLPQLTSMTSPPRAMIFTATFALAVLLLTPDAVAFVLRLGRWRDPRWRLGQRQLIADQQRAMIAVLVLSVGLGLPLGFVTLLDTMVSTANNRVYPAVLPGQVSVQGTGSNALPASAAIVTVAKSTALASRPQIQTRYVGSLQGLYVTVTGTDLGGVLALDSPGDVTDLLGQDLSPRQTQTLLNGGLLVWGDAAQVPAGPQMSRTLTSMSGKHTSLTPLLPSLPMNTPEVGWGVGTDGVLLTATASAMDLPTWKAAVVYTGVPEHDAATAQLAIVAAGLNPKEMVVFRPPTAIVPYAALYASAVGLLLLIFLIGAAVANGQVRALRRYLAGLLTIGIPLRWTRHVLLFEHSLIIIMSTICAALIAIPPVIISALLMSGFSLAVPWGWLGLILVAFYGATIATTVMSNWRLRASERW